jgi:hypothetical protein
VEARSELKYGLRWRETQSNETQGRAAVSSGANTEHGHWDLNPPQGLGNSCCPPTNQRNFGWYRSRNRSYMHSEIQKRKELAVAPAGADAVLIGSVITKSNSNWCVRTRLDMKDTFGPRVTNSSLGNYRFIIPRFIIRNSRLLIGR